MLINFSLVPSVVSDLTLTNIFVVVKKFTLNGGDKVLTIGPWCEWGVRVVCYFVRAAFHEK